MDACVGPDLCWCVPQRHTRVTQCPCAREHSVLSGSPAGESESGELLRLLLQDATGLGQTQRPAAHLVLIKDVENKRGELGGVSKREELFVDLLEASRVQLPTGAVLNKALVPADNTQAAENITHYEPLPETRESYEP